VEVEKIIKLLKIKNNKDFKDIRKMIENHSLRYNKKEELGKIWFILSEEQINRIIIQIYIIIVKEMIKEHIILIDFN
jgi:hypothetical protein